MESSESSGNGNGNGDDPDHPFWKNVSGDTNFSSQIA
jgi:hypothetical protein